MHFKAEILLLMVPMVAWVSCQDCKKVELKGYQGTFHSPNYPKHYDHKANCMWIITAPPDTFIHLSFDTFDVKNPFWECTHDYVDIIYDDTKSERFCTDNPPPTTIKSITNILKLSLKSDRFFLNGIGFEATYTVVDSTGKALKQEGDDDQDETTTVSSSTTTTTPSTTSSTTTSTTTSKSTTTTTTPKTTSLMSKITTTTRKKSTTGEDDPGSDGISGNPGAMSGVVIAVIIGVVLLVLLGLVFVACIQYKRNKNKRINLNVVDSPDDLGLISNGKVYKKLDNKIVRVPEAETFPL